jgi:parallel beta-helix repeat protein
VHGRCCTPIVHETFFQKYYVLLRQYTYGEGKVVRKIVSGIMSILLVLSMLSLLSYIRPVRAQGTIYIQADGSIYPSDAPISTVDDITYTLTGNITADTNGIVIERDNIVLNGAGYTVQGTALYNSEGIYLDGVSNVTVKNTNVITFPEGIVLVSSWNNNISGNNITNNGRGIVLSDSSSNIVSGNNVVDNDYYGIVLENGSCENNTLSGNNITNNGYGIDIFLTSGHNSISGNNITANNEYGIWISHSSANSISGNNITNNTCGIYLHLYMTVYNSVFHNSIVNNTIQAQDYGVYTTWDYGYPSGGNCWGNYNGTDFIRVAMRTKQVVME